MQGKGERVESLRLAAVLSGDVEGDDAARQTLLSVPLPNNLNTIRTTQHTQHPTPHTPHPTHHTPSSEGRGNTLKGCKNFCLQAKARI